MLGALGRRSPCPWISMATIFGLVLSLSLGQCFSGLWAGIPSILRWERRSPGLGASLFLK